VLIVSLPKQARPKKKVRKIAVQAKA